MSPERSVRTSARKQALLGFVETELERLQSKEIPQLSSNEELRTNFGYPHKSAVLKDLRSGGLVEARRAINPDFGGRDLTHRLPFVHRPGRKQSFTEYVREENERFRRGEIPRVSTNEELRERFGYANVSSFYSILRQENLIGERRQLLQEKGRERLIPSRELAWLLGVIASGGNVSKSGAVAVSSKEDNLVQTFRESSERAFKLNCRLRDVRTCADGSIYRLASFTNISIARAIGDLKRPFWPQTLLERHDWIFTDQRYLWALIEGIFETRCYVNREQGIVFSSNYSKVNQFMLGILTKVGLQNATDRPSNTTKERTMGVRIGRKPDIRLFAQNVHSVIPVKEEYLEPYRAIEPKSKPKKYSPKPSKSKKVNVVITELDAITSQTENLRSITDKQMQMLKEWLRLTTKLGHDPSANEIAKMNKSGQTPFVADTYAYNFGRAEDGTRTFSRAKANIIRLLENPENIETLRSEIYGKQWEAVENQVELIGEYKIARDLAIKINRFPPTIHFIAELRRRGIIKFTAHTLANYFGNRSFPKAREELERIIRERGNSDET